jgi:tRNA threonylcarbamoyladenosine biosynthesis protein TsaB
VAVVRDNDVLAELSGDPAVTHGQRLPLDLMRVLDAARTRLEDVELLAVAAGPGSFTGLRVGIATAQGLALARGLRIVPVSTLEALAREALHDAGREALIGAWIDAQRGEVFATLFGAAREQVLAPPSSAKPLETLSGWRPHLGSSPVLFAGDGAVRYRDVIASTLGEQARFMDRVPALAAAIGRIAAQEPDRAVMPHAVVPIYIRRSDAELARERSAAR